MNTQESSGTASPLTLMDLTVNICTVDRPEALRAAIKSLLETTPPGPTLQLLLNEASPETWPAVEDLLQQWKGPVNVIRIDERVPVTQSHQTALDAVKTPLVNFMGDDDVVFGDRFTEAIKMFNDVKDLKMLGSWVHRVGGDFDEPVRMGKMDVGPVTLEEWESYRSNSTPVQYCFPAIIFDTEAARAAGGFQERFGSAMDAALSGYIGRQWPSLTQTSRLFGFRIHDGSDSAKNFGHQFERYEYFEECLRCLDRGEPEPTFEVWKHAMDQRPVWRRLAHDRMVQSRHMFRRSGAALVDNRKGDFVKYAALSFLAWPPQFFSKVIEQRGRADR
ncbi:MAG: glycosyltransferase [Acidimicrobiales bacterium]